MDRSPEEERVLQQKCNEDRDILMEQIINLYPESQGQPPSALVEDIIHDICEFTVVDRPLSLGQLALCDFGRKMILVNSKTRTFVHHKVNLDTLRKSTLAHELGHIRLHQTEMTEKLFISYHGSGGRFDDSRAIQKEHEANLYAALFLLPEQELRATRPIQNLLKNREDGREMKSSTLWKSVYQLSQIFGVTPTLLKRRLIELGWINQQEATYESLHQLRLYFENAR